VPEGDRANNRILCCCIGFVYAMSFTDFQQHVVNMLSFSFGLLGFCCSATTLLLIYNIKKWNGYLVILTSMTICQVLYDMNYVLRIVEQPVSCYVVMFLDILGGLGVSFWTNILAFAITYTVISCSSINIFKYYPWFSVFGTLVPFLAAVYTVGYPPVLSVTSNGQNSCHYGSSSAASAAYLIYYWGRLLSVIFTFLCCGITIWKIRRMRLGAQWVHKSMKSNRPLPINAESSAILTTVVRMNYYAIAQAICRSGAAWNEVSF
jgi:hypothetical protein